MRTWNQLLRAGPGHGRRRVHGKRGKRPQGRPVRASQPLAARSRVMLEHPIRGTARRCGTSGPGTAPNRAPRSALSQTGEPMSTTTHPITITLGGSLLAATLDDSPASRSLLRQLPVTVSFSDYAGQEILAALPEALDVTGMSAAAPQAGDIAWYTPNKVLVLAYSSVGHWPGLYVIGRISGDTTRTASTLRSMTGPVEAVIRQARGR
ncbi:hypothetical protein D5R93_01810 [Actinomyces lilanjuaniae]|uniref:Cyclophilin-like domain-containing protein n=2 Tax=Actinomyces lilanjuaniae TaxID=2321394 RepID=A0ABM6Z1G1_9ACTO|nr:hypothetical protein D5R93_01810 [Actinomyces lilanjuaniae]